MYNDYKDVQASGIGNALSPVQESKRDQLERERKHLMSRIEDIDRLIALMDKSPDTEELINLLRRV
jgi:hypothetical protein